MSRALTKTTWYPILKKVARTIGQKITKDTVKDTIIHNFSILGAIVSGTITLVSFRPLGTNLSKVYVDILNGKYDVEMVMRDDFINLEDFDVQDADYEVIESDDYPEKEEDEDYVIPVDIENLKDIKKEAENDL